MKKVFVFCVVLAASMSSFGQDAYTDLMPNFTWTASHALGTFDSLTHPSVCSTYVDQSMLMTDSTITAYLQRATRLDTAAADNAPWPWVQLAGKGPTSFAGATSIKITYSASDTVWVVFQQPGLAVSGESFLCSLPPAAAFSTVVIPVTSLKQPSWVSPPARLALDSIYGATFEVNVADYSKVQTLNLSVKYVGILAPAGVIGSTVGRNTAGTHSLMAIQKVDERSLQFAIPAAGSYSLTMNMLNGKSLELFSNRHFGAGNQTVDLNSKLIPGMYVFKLTGDAGSESSKLMVR